MRSLSSILLLAITLPFYVSAVVDLDSFAGPAPESFKGLKPTTPTDPASTNYTAGSTSRLAFYVPTTAWPKYPGWLTFYKSLVMIGIPVRVTTSYTEASKHSVVLAYQAFTSTVPAAESTAWKTYVDSGKVLITTTLTTTDQNIRNLFGVTPDTTGATARDLILLQNVATAPGKTYMSEYNYTDPRDSEISIWGSINNKGFPTVSYKPKGTTVALAGYRRQGSTTQEANAIAISLNVNNNNNKGQTIAIGIDVGEYIGICQGNNTWGIPRDYAASYEPGYDTFLRLIKSVYSNNAGYVTIWPVPKNKGVHYVWSYDIDASGSWAGAVISSKALLDDGVPGTINWQTKLVEDGYDTAFFTENWKNISIIEGYGNMELASHSVSHSINLAKFPIGTGKEVYNTTRYREGDSYWPFIGECTNKTGPFITNVPDATTCDTPTDVFWFYTIQSSLIAEVRISKFLLESTSTKNDIVRSYRTGHLIFPLPMPDIWDQYGIKYDSSGAANDQNTHLPYQLFSNRGYAREVDVLEFCMTTSDEDLLPMNADWALPGSTKYPGGSALYQQLELVKKLAVYGGSYTFLIHPTSFGVGIPWATTVQLFDDKLAFQKAFVPLVKNISYFDTMGGRGDFTYARLKTGVDWTMSGTTVTVVVDCPLPIKELTLRFPTTWTLLTSTTAVTTPDKGAVVLSGSIASGKYTLTFTTATTTATPTFPTDIPSVPFPSNTQAAATTAVDPDPKHKTIDDFSDPRRYNVQDNALKQYTYDDATTVSRTSVQGDWLLIDFNTTSYWYTLFGPAGKCNDYSDYDTLQLSLRFPLGKAVVFSVNLQDVDTATCNNAESHYLPVGPGTNYTLANSKDWQRMNIPLKDFGVTTTAIKALTLAKWAEKGMVELDYVFVGNGSLY